MADVLLECDYQSEKRVYAPHVTLMRKLTKPGDFSEIDHIAWQVNEFVLVESVPVDGGVKYEVIENYPL